MTQRPATRVRLLALLAFGTLVFAACHNGGRADDPSSDVGQDVSDSTHGDDASDDAACTGDSCPDADASTDDDAELDGSGDADATQDSGQPDAGSSYTSAITLPECDASSEDVVLIESVADLAQLDAPDIHVFCLTPNDYSSAGRVVLTASGTADQPRVLRYFNPAQPASDAHPVNMSEDQLAIFEALDVTGSHWVIDRLTVRPDDEVTLVGAVQLRNATDNVINRLLAEESKRPLFQFRNDAHRNVLQNSVLRKARQPGNDRNCVAFSPNEENAVLEDNRIVANEIYDCTDGVQLVISRGQEFASYPGTVIADNDIYISDAFRSDCNGNLDPNGACACAEDALDIKGAAQSADVAPVEVLDNRIWGHRETDTACGGTGGGGGSMVIHKGIPYDQTEPASYVRVQGNIFFDTPTALTMGWGAHHVSFVDNLVHGTGDAVGSDRPTIITSGNRNLEFYRNTFVDADPNWLALNNTSTVDIRCNTLIDSGWAAIGGSEQSSTTADYNAFYGTDDLPVSGSNALNFDTASAAEHAERCFTIRRWTNPEEVCLPSAQPTSSSPHFEHCDPDLGSVEDVGVDDQPY